MKVLLKLEQYVSIFEAQTVKQTRVHVLTSYYNSEEPTVNTFVYTTPNLHQSLCLRSYKGK